jgi:AcrR family transcriptional regulator
VLSERGYHDTSVDEIAARAHAGKDTIYRRWPHKSDLILAALEQIKQSAVDVPDSGSLAEDLLAYLTDIAHLLCGSPFGDTMLALIGESHHNGDLGRSVAGFWDTRRRQIGSIVDRGAMRGEITVGAAALLPDLLLGALYYRWLVRAESPDDRYLRQLVASVIEGQPQPFRRAERGAQVHGMPKDCGPSPPKPR